MIPLDDPDTLRDLVAQFRDTADAAYSLHASAILDALAVELHVKADAVETLINLTTSAAA